MPFQELFDETLDINSTENYDLSVQMNPEGFSFSLLDTIRNKYVLLRSFEPEENKYFNATRITEILEKDDFLGRRYKKVNVIIPTQKFTIIPSPLFDPGKKEEYYSYNQIKHEGDTILVNKINDPDSFLVFSVSKSFIELINRFYPGVHPWHHLKPLLNHISHSRKSSNGFYIHIHVEREFFNLAVHNNDKLLFCNSFNYRNISDILYFTLNAFKNLNIKQEETIHFSGMTEKYDDISSTFSMYIRNIRFSEPSGNFTFSYVFNDTDLHRYINLFNAVNCE